MAAPRKKAIKRDAGDAAVMVQRVFPGTMVVQWGSRTYLAPPAAPKVEPPSATPRKKKKEEVVEDGGPRLF